MKKTQTLLEFCKGRGEHASAEIGVSYATISRILHKKTHPSQMLRARFKQLGIIWPDKQEVKPDETQNQS